MLSGTAEGWLEFLWPFCFAAGSLLAARSLIHWFQLESYQFPGYFRTVKRQGIRAWIPGAGMAAGALLCLLAGKLFFPDSSPWGYLLCADAAPLAVGAGIRALGMRRKEKKKLVFTPRVKRLYGISFVLWTLLLFVFLPAPFRAPRTLSTGLLLCGAALMLPMWTALGGLLAWPVEKAISEMYFRDAQRILRERKDLIRIGITGSWGKTSVKFILGTMLSEKYPTLVTPASFNTPMGVTRVIRTMLEPGHRVFVAEMGARHVGDIREMCRLVHPVLGMITSVGPQHLDTFHTQERITGTKYELIEALPEDGAAFFADDGGIVRGLWEKTGKEKYLTGMDPERDDIWAEELSVSSAGSKFTLCTRTERIPCETQLLGELNIRNILLCAAVCRKLGMTGKEIARGIRRLKPVEHRLELKRNPGGILVLDDAFNSNIRGAEQAFRTLKDFTGGKRIVVTPGMVELGDREESMNREFGRDMADCCDEAVLVGRKRSVPLSAGLADAGFPEDHIHVTGSLGEAADLLKTLAAPGDTILFENDLPDNYEE